MGIFFITKDRAYIHNTIVIAVIILGTKSVNPSALLAKLFEVTPRKTATPKDISNAKTTHRRGACGSMSFDVGQGPEIEHSELPALEQLTKMGYEYKAKTNLNKERKKTTEVLLYGRLREALKRINPEIDDDGITDAINQIREDSFPFSYPIMETNEKIHAKMAGLSQSGGL